MKLFSRKLITKHQRSMKEKSQARRNTQRALMAAIAISALAAPAARAQSSEEFKQLKALMEQLQKTIDAQNARIADLEKGKTNVPAPPMPGITAQTSPSIRTVEKVAAGEDVGHKSPVTYRGNLNDQQEAASRPKDFTLDPKNQGFIPIPNTPALIKFNAKPHLDMIWDNKNAGNQNRFVPASFPLRVGTDNSGSGQFHITANAIHSGVDVRALEMDGNFRF